MSRTTTALLLTGALLATPLAVAHAADDPLPPLVFTSDRDGDSEIYLRNPNGTVRKLTSNTAPDYGAVWSPDGRRLAFVSARDGDDEIFVMNADGSGLRQLTRNSRASNGAPANDNAPAWSPDGTRLAFASTRDGGEAEIYRMNADGSSQVRLTRTAAHVADHTPSWSPGGHYLVFSSNRVSFENMEVYRMRMNGTELVRLTTTADGVDDNAPEYSPDGRRIAFSSTRSGSQHDLFTMAGNGGDVRRLAGDSGLDDVFPHWTGDGRAVLFSTFAGPDGRPSEDLWVVRSDGTGLRRLTTATSADSFPDAKPR